MIGTYLFAAGTLCGALIPAAGPTPGAPSQPTGQPVLLQGEQDPEALALRELIGRLPVAEAQKLADYLRLDLEGAETFQRLLIRHGLGLLESDPGFLEPAAPEVWFDPVEHAPGQPIPRQLLPADSPTLTAFTERLARRNPLRRMRSGYAYDWGQGQIVRLTGADDPKRLLLNALEGFAPDLDLIEAIAIRALDDGSQRKTLAAFDHDYTDRDGNVYRGVSLFAAWSSGLEIEMPDVDTLGLLHTLFEKYPKSWKAPVPGSAHKALYGKLFEAFTPAKQQRSLCEALGRIYVASAPELWFGFTPAHQMPLHLFWEQRSSDLQEADRAMPAPAKWETFLSDLTQRANKDKEAFQAARNRSGGLAEGEAYVRRRLAVLAADMRLAERFPPASGRNEPGAGR